MKILIFGAGRIGRGFVTGLLSQNNAEITFFDYSNTLIKTMNDVKSYTIHVLGNEDKNITVSSYSAYSLDERTAMENTWKNADYIFTAVGGKNLAAVAKLIAETFKNTITECSGYKNIVTCENWINPAAELQTNILENLTDDQKQLFSKYIGISEAVVMTTGTSAPPNANVKKPVDTWVQDFWYLPVDKDRIKGTLPDWKYFDFITDFGNLLQQKIYTNNTSVALIAYLGYLKGHEYVADAANDPQIVPILEKAYEEINFTLVSQLGVTEADQLNFSKRAKKKYQDRNIIDLVTRIARDPIRKLQPSDRLIGPTRLALKAGIIPTALPMAIAAALFFDYDKDDIAVKLSKMRQQYGIKKVLNDICGISDKEKIYELIMKSIDTLKSKGWIK